MHPKDAKQILTGMRLDEFNQHRLDFEPSRWARHLFVSSRNGTGFLGGAFTADELEAIATWIRDPVGVVGAE